MDSPLLATLDDAMQQLPENDRTAIVLRYFEDQSLRHVGLALGATEDAARKRVSRAVEKLRTLLAKRGVSLTATGLASVLATDTVGAAPAHLVESFARNALATVGAGANAAISASSILQAKSIASVAFSATVALLLGGGALFELKQRSALKERLAGLQANVDVAERQASDLRKWTGATMTALGQGRSVPSPGDSPPAASQPGQAKVESNSAKTPAEVGAIFGALKKLEKEFWDTYSEIPSPDSPGYADYIADVDNFMLAVAQSIGAANPHYDLAELWQSADLQAAMLSTSLGLDEERAVLLNDVINGAHGRLDDEGLRRANLEGQAKSEWAPRLQRLVIDVRSQLADFLTAEELRMLNDQYGWNFFYTPNIRFPKNISNETATQSSE